MKKEKGVHGRLGMSLRVILLFFWSFLSKWEWEIIGKIGKKFWPLSNNRPIIGVRIKSERRRALMKKDEVRWGLRLEMIEDLIEFLFDWDKGFAKATIICENM